MRQVALRVAGARGKAVVQGSPQQIADQMEEWFRKDGCDGFNLMPPFLPGGLDDFVELVLPELRRRGLFRTEYEGRTLREHLGLARPPSRYAAAAEAGSRTCGRAVARIGLSGSGVSHGRHRRSQKPARGRNYPLVAIGKPYHCPRGALRKSEGVSPMRAWKSALAVAVCALGLGLLPAAHAQFKPTPAPGGGTATPGGPAAPPQAQGDQFMFKVCNRSKIPLFVGDALQGRRQRLADGRLGALQARRMRPGAQGTFPRDDFYWYAEDGPGNVTYRRQGRLWLHQFRPTASTAPSAATTSARRTRRSSASPRSTTTSIRDGITLTD